MQFDSKLCNFYRSYIEILMFSRFSAWFWVDMLGMGFRMLKWVFVCFSVLNAMGFQFSLLCLILISWECFFFSLSFCVLLRFETVLRPFDNG